MVPKQGSFALALDCISFLWGWKHSQGRPLLIITVIGALQIPVSHGVVNRYIQQIYCSAPPEGLLAGAPVDKNHGPLARLSVIHIARNGKEDVHRKVDPG